MEKKSKAELIFGTLLDGETTDLGQVAKKEKMLNFKNLDVDSIRPKKKAIEYSSVKIRVDLYEKIKAVAKKQGVNQPGKFISLILESFLAQADKK